MSTTITPTLLPPEAQNLLEELLRTPPTNVELIRALQDLVRAYLDHLRPL